MRPLPQPYLIPGRCDFCYLRLITLLFFCLWLVLIIFDRFLWYQVIPSYPNVHPLSPMVLLKQSLSHNNNNADNNQQNGSSMTGSASSSSSALAFDTALPYSAFVQLNRAQVKDGAINVVLFWNTYFGVDILTHESVTSQSFFRSLFGIGGRSIEKNDDIPTSRFYRPRVCYHTHPNCFITTDRSQLPYANIVTFHWRDFNANDIPSMRTPAQEWALYNLEAPPNTERLPTEDRTDEWLRENAFNLTATYRADSDVQISYGTAHRRQPNSTKSQWRPPDVELRQKTKPIAWFVSHCPTQSHREDYARALARLIPVDIYGSCGTFTCDKRMSDDCYQMVARDYLFYLSFENSICRDYVTEKLFLIMQYDIVPVVLGGANYTALLPPHSFIDATDMRPAELARMLIIISNDREKYLRYFEWRKHWVVHSFNDYNELLFCKLCERIQQQQQQQRKMKQNGQTNKTKNISKTMAQINQWYFDDNVCESNRVKLY